ncbi:MAG TPA: hypothetical protein VM681_11000 [Candidatus Thermoplasmatota archaeon]|nr:hypothetical protein [Candidatus Thermoplasmatota archaeon]
MKSSYPEEKYDVAVRALAIGTDSIQHRLREAYISIMRLQKMDLKEEKLWQEHESIINSLTGTKQGPGDDPLDRTLRQMSDSDASRIADRIVSFSYEVRRR